MNSIKIHLLALLFCFSWQARAQTETDARSEINAVTIFLSGAQIFQEASANIPSGESIVVLKGISPYMVDRSIQVKGKGAFTIQAVNRRMNYLKDNPQEVNEDEISKGIGELEREIKVAEARESVLKEKESVLMANKKISGSQSNLSVIEFENTLKFFDEALMKIKEEELSLDERKKKNALRIRQLRNQLSANSLSNQESTSQILVRIKAERATTAIFEINYLVENAGWYPKYDIRVKDVSQPLLLNYKAEVYQNTGVDWKDVKMKFSNGNPNKNGLAPELDKWELNYARLTTYTPKSTRPFEGIVEGVVLSAEDGKPLPGATVLVRGTTIGTSTGPDGRYSLAVPDGDGSLVYSFVGYSTQELPIRQRATIDMVLNPDNQTLSEVVVTGYSSKEKRSLARSSDMEEEASLIETIIQENQTTVEIEVSEPYSIRSEGPKTLVDLRQYEIPAQFQYRAIPKLDSDAYLLAQINDWSQYNLLQGESNLYFEDGYVGRSILATSANADSLGISLGRDQSILISREKNQEFSKKRSIGSNITESRQFEITIRNNKSTPISIQVLDQIPVSVNSEITVESTELSRGNLDEGSGIVTWVLNLGPGEQEVLTLGYEVKYPKREKVIIE